MSVNVKCVYTNAFAHNNYNAFLRQKEGSPKLENWKSLSEWQGWERDALHRKIPVEKFASRPSLESLSRFAIIFVTRDPGTIVWLFSLISISRHSRPPLFGTRPYSKFDYS